MRVIIAGGGTGGHLFPAVALAEELKSRLPDLSLLFVGAEGGVEASLVAARGWDFGGIRASGFQGKRLSQRLRSLALIPLSLTRSRSILRQFRPDVVVGFGGYASAAMVLAAALAGVPTVIHEQNAFPGLANRRLGGVVGFVAVGFEAASGFFPRVKVRVTGNPVRREIFGVTRAEAAAGFGLYRDRFTLLIFGGSQGAHKLNRAMLGALPLLGPERGQVQFLHATGPREVDQVREGYLVEGHHAVVKSFFQEMGMAYSAADLCLCRAGAGTIAELCALGKPSVLVPFPFSTDNHQHWNAEAVVAFGGARLIEDRELDGAAVAEIIRMSLRDREGLDAMGRSAKALAKLDATARLADLVMESVHSRHSPARSGARFQRSADGRPSTLKGSP